MYCSKKLLLSSVKDGLESVKSGRVGPILAWRKSICPAYESLLVFQMQLLRKEEELMFIILCAVLFIAWLLGMTAFHVAGGLIHILLVLAVISIIMHFVRGRSAV